MVLIGARSRLSLPLRGNRQLPPRACLHVLDESEVASLPQRFVLFTDLHVQRSTLPVCVQLLRKVAGHWQRGELHPNPCGPGRFFAKVSDDPRVYVDDLLEMLTVRCTRCLWWLCR